MWRDRSSQAGIKFGTAAVNSAVPKQHFFIFFSPFFHFEFRSDPDPIFFPAEPDPGEKISGPHPCLIGDNVCV